MITIDDEGSLNMDKLEHLKAQKAELEEKKKEANRAAKQAHKRRSEVVAALRMTDRLIEELERSRLKIAE